MTTKRFDNGARTDEMTLSAVLIPDSEGRYTALNPETGTTTEGETVVSDANDYRDSADGDLKARITWQPITDKDPGQDGWRRL